MYACTHKYLYVYECASLYYYRIYSSENIILLKFRRVKSEFANRNNVVIVHNTHACFQDQKKDTSAYIVIYFDSTIEKSSFAIY